MKRSDLMDSKCLHEAHRVYRFHNSGTVKMGRISDSHYAIMHAGLRRKELRLSVIVTNGCEQFSDLAALGCPAQHDIQRQRTSIKFLKSKQLNQFVNVGNLGDAGGIA